MPVTSLDGHAALVVIDLQPATVARPLAHSTAEIVARAADLAAAFRRHGLPVVLVNAAGTPPGQSDRGGGATARWPEEATRLLPELGAQEHDLRITKTAWGAFAGTDLHGRLGELGVTRVVLAGVATSFGVESTARAAYDLGYHVVFATDA